jgi:hypothetical protein
MSSPTGNNPSQAVLLELRMANLKWSDNILNSFFEGANKHVEIMELFTKLVKTKASEEQFAGKLKELFLDHSKLAEKLIGYFESIQTISAKLEKE